MQRSSELPGLRHSDSDLEDNAEPVDMETEDPSDEGDDQSIQSRSIDGSFDGKDEPPRRERSPPLRYQQDRESGNYSHKRRSDSSRKSDNKVASDEPRDEQTRSRNTVLVTNISPLASMEQLKTLFGFLGDIKDIALYQIPHKTQFKVCFIEFSQPSSALMAQHLTNVILIDRALVVLPYSKHGLPADKESALADGLKSIDYVTLFNDNVHTQVAFGPGGAQLIVTNDSRLSDSSLQTYPPLPINTDPTRTEEVRRTLYIGNLDSTIPPDQVLKFFNDIGEVKYIRVAGDDTQPTRFAFVEFTHQSSVANALQHNGFVLGSRALKINHSNNPIVKPPLPKLEREDLSKKNLRHDLRSRDSKDHGGRHRSRRDRDRGRYDRRLSPSELRRRSRSRESRSRRSRSRDHSSRRSRSRELYRRRSRSRDATRKRRSRSRSVDRKPKKRSRRRR